MDFTLNSTQYYTHEPRLWAKAIIVGNTFEKQVLGYRILDTVWDVLTQPSMSFRVNDDAMMPP